MRVSAETASSDMVGVAECLPNLRQRWCESVVDGCMRTSRRIMVTMMLITGKLRERVRIIDIDGGAVHAGLTLSGTRWGI